MDKEVKIMNLIQEYCQNECCEFPYNCNENCVLRRIERVISEESKYETKDHKIQ